MRTIKGARFEGAYGSAQHVSVPDRRNAGVNLAAWFMRLPNQTIGADHFMLWVSSLEPREDLPAPNLHYEGAEYELAVMSMDPDRGPSADDSDTWSYLLPSNVCVQFHGISREQAARVGGTVAEACTLGRLPAETQMYVAPFGGEPKMMFIRELVDMWKAAVAQLVDHERTGGLHGRVN